MSSEMITKMIDGGSINHGHHILNHVHTDNLVNDSFIFNHKLGDMINTKLYQELLKVKFDALITLDNSALIMAFPISLMMKCDVSAKIPVSDLIIPERDVKDVVVLTTIINNLDVLADSIIALDYNVTHIFCVTNYSGFKTINGKPIIEIVKVNTWLPEECPYCKE